MLYISTGLSQDNIDCYNIPVWVWVSCVWCFCCLIYFLFSALLGEMIQFDEHIFQMGGSTTNPPQESNGSGGVDTRLRFWEEKTLYTKCDLDLRMGLIRYDRMVLDMMNILVFKLKSYLWGHVMFFLPSVSFGFYIHCSFRPIKS